METILGNIMIRAGAAVWCYYIAKGNGRNTNWAIFWGIITPFLAVIIYYCIGKSSGTKQG